MSNLIYFARVGVLFAIFAGLTFGLTGCAGLSVSWKVVATYNTPHEAPGPSVPVDVEQKK